MSRSGHVQDTPALPASPQGLRAASRRRALAATPVRRLPVQKDWPTWAIVTTQVGILVGIIALWEIGAPHRDDQRLLLVAADARSATR